MKLKEFEKQYKSVFEYKNIVIRSGDIIGIDHNDERDEIVYNIKINKENEIMDFDYIYENEIEEDDDEACIYTLNKFSYNFNRIKRFIDNDRLIILK